MNHIKSYGFIVAHEFVQKTKLVQIHVKSYGRRGYSQYYSRFPCIVRVLDNFSFNYPIIIRFGSLSLDIICRRAWSVNKYDSDKSGAATGELKFLSGTLPHILLSLISRRDYASSINTGMSMEINASVDRDKSNAAL